MTPLGIGIEIWISKVVETDFVVPRRIIIKRINSKLLPQLTFAG